MKVLELRFKNLNSLYGEWTIDFTNPEYTSNGIFALTGPTGAGKSTILDAICLSLYGATPRLGKITKKGNEIMSRQTGECYAEVVFESQDGRFLCHWEQRRARKKADGNLQDQEHQIADAETGKLIENKKSLVSRVVEEKTGMDFDRFTRSILLAQGGFDTFLKANIEQKSKILEQITGTQIYTEISRRVHERQRNEQEKLKLLEAETSGIEILDLEQEKKIEHQIETTQEQETALAGKLVESKKAVAWRTLIDDLNKEIVNLEKEAVTLNHEIETFKPGRAKLDQAIKAATLDGSFEALKVIRKQQADDLASLKIEETTLPEIISQADKQVGELKTAEQQTLKAKAALEAAAPLIQRIRSLDQKLFEQKNAIAEITTSCTKDTEQIQTDKQTLLKEQERHADAQRSINSANEYLEAHTKDEWLVSNLAGVEQQLQGLLSRQQQIAQKQSDLKKAETVLEQTAKKLDKCKKQSGLCKQELKAAAKKFQQGKDTLSEVLGDRLLREYRTEKETLLREMAFISKIAELEDHRANLEDGKPCPLCGAKDHPFAKGNMPVPDKIEKKIVSLTTIIARAEDLGTANEKLEKAETNARKRLIDSKNQEEIAATEKKAAGKTLVQLQKDFAEINTNISEQKDSIFNKLKPLGIVHPAEEGVSSLIGSLKVRLKKMAGPGQEKDGN